MFNDELNKLDGYNQEVKKFFINILWNDKKIDTIKDVLDSLNMELNLRLDPSDYNILNKNFPKTMKTIQNGCGPAYLPKWVKVNKCLKRKKECNKHDFYYWIGWFRKQSDKLFLKGMNKVCKSFGEKTENYIFYWLVRYFGSSAFSGEEKTLDDFFRIKIEK